MKKHYTSIAEFFKVSPKCFWKLGVLNTLVDRDIQLFIDPNSQRFKSICGIFFTVIFEKALPTPSSK